jgi:GntR family transcriptional regulator/MocR family aminotransferase
LDFNISKFSNRFVVAPENLISEAKTICNAGPPRRFTRTNAIELIYEGEIHRLLKKTYWSISKDAIFFYQCLEENFKDAIRFKKPTGGSQQYGYSLIR